MTTKKVVAVIGASGKMGAGFAKTLSKGNYRLLLQSPEWDKLQSIIDEIRSKNPFADVEAVADSAEACWEADVIIAAVPYEAEQEVADSITKVVNQKIVVSVSNPINSNYDGMLTAPNTSAAEELQRRLPYAKVVKAFNTTFAHLFDHPIIDAQKTDCFIAGNDDEAIGTVYELVKTAGFNPVMVGDLSMSRTLENMQLLLIRFSAEHSYYDTTGWKILHN